MDANSILLERVELKPELSFADCCATCQHVEVIDGEYHCPLYSLDGNTLVYQPWIVCPKYKRHNKFSGQVMIEEI